MTTTQAIESEATIQARINARAVRLATNPNGYTLMNELKKELKHCFAVHRDVCVSDGVTMKQGLPAEWFDGRTDREHQTISIHDLELCLDGHIPESDIDHSIYC